MDKELTQLISEQKKDMDSFTCVPDRKLRNAYEFPLSNGDLTRLSDTIQAKHDSQGKITWGMPAQTCQINMDRACSCGETPKTVNYEQTRLISGMELDSDSCLCSNCNFTF